MMNYLDYDRLTEVVKCTKPYRGNSNRYPILQRRYSHKHFIVHTTEDGEVEYHIAYYTRHEPVGINEEQYKNLKELEKTSVNRGWYVIANGGREEGVDEEYIQYVRKPRVLGVVRSDNTFEFTSDKLDIGDRLYLNTLLGNPSSGWSRIYSNTRYGGVILERYARNHEYFGNSYDSRYWKTTHIVPLFKGQRLNLNTFESVSDYAVGILKVNPKRNKVVRAEYKDNLTIAKTFFKTMSLDTLSDELMGVYDEIVGTDRDGQWYIPQKDRNLINDALLNTIDIDIFKSLCCCMLLSSIYSADYCAKTRTPLSNSYYSDKSPIDFYDKAVKLLHDFIKTNKFVYDMTVYKSNEVYPTSRRNILIKYNDEPVKQY